jgi:hypothetical protein
MGIVEIETASSAQLKGIETMVAGIGDSEMGTGDNSERVTVGNGDSVWVDMVAEEGREMIGGLV